MKEISFFVRQRNKRYIHRCPFLDIGLTVHYNLLAFTWWTGFRKSESQRSWSIGKNLLYLGVAHCDHILVVDSNDIVANTYSTNSLKRWL